MFEKLSLFQFDSIKKKLQQHIMLIIMIVIEITINIIDIFLLFLELLLYRKKSSLEIEL
jgi:hypothetical protein